MYKRQEKSSQVILMVPESAPAGSTIHLVLEVYDDKPIASLKSYRRVVLTVD